METFEEEKKLMLENQIKARGVTNEKVLNAIKKIPRHKFVPQEHIKYAYADSPLPIGHGQTISQPYIVALMTELLEPDKTKKVLEIGTGCGYQTAICAETFKEVYTVEIIPELAEMAKKNLTELGYQNIKIKTGDGHEGWEEYAPYDAIIVTAAPEEIPQKLTEQLKNNGKMVIPVGKIFQDLALIEKQNGKIKKTNIIPVRFVPMVKKQNL